MADMIIPGRMYKATTGFSQVGSGGRVFPAGTVFTAGETCSYLDWYAWYISTDEGTFMVYPGISAEEV